MSLSQSIARSGVAHFINSRTGRLTRIIVRLVIIIWGYVQLEQTSGIILILVGLIPLSAGLFDLCIINQPFNRWSYIRQENSDRQQLRPDRILQTKISDCLVTYTAKIVSRR